MKVSEEARQRVREMSWALPCARVELDLEQQSPFVKAASGDTLEWAFDPGSGDVEPYLCLHTSCW